MGWQSTHPSALIEMMTDEPVSTSKIMYAKTKMWPTLIEPEVSRSRSMSTRATSGCPSRIASARGVPAQKGFGEQTGASRLREAHGARVAIPCTHRPSDPSG